LRSGLGIGSTFFVTIPYEPANKEQLGIDSNQTTKMSNPVPSCTVLIAEDEEINYLYLEIILKEKMLLNCNIIHAKNGQEAVNICNNNKIDLIFMDLKMPLIDGYQATKLIKKTHPNLPIIAHSASTTEYAKEAILKSGFDDYISKPINQSDFYQLIEKYNLRSCKLT
jgi:CheY-like chemotaxis protein